MRRWRKDSDKRQREEKRRQEVEETGHDARPCRMVVHSALPTIRILVHAIHPE